MSKVFASEFSSNVIELDASLNRVIVAPRKDSSKSSCIVKEINWVSIKAPKKPIKVEVQIRYRSKPVKGKLIPLKTNNNINNKFKLIFNDDQSSITPGQAAVFYQDEILLGGGIIT